MVRLSIQQVSDHHLHLSKHVASLYGDHTHRRYDVLERSDSIVAAEACKDTISCTPRCSSQDLNTSGHWFTFECITIIIYLFITTIILRRGGREQNNISYHKMCLLSAVITITKCKIPIHRTPPPPPPPPPSGGHNILMCHVPLQGRC